MLKWTLQRIFQQYPPEQYGVRLPLEQHKALAAIRDCRTAVMGSHSEYCQQGHLCGVFYNSCRHRGCPQCQHVKREQWLVQWSARLLNTQHHHWVFTCPHELLPLWRYNQAWFQDCLYTSVNKTLKQLSAAPKHLGAQPGYLLALHSWSRKLSEHPHIHALISHGGLTPGGDWCLPRRKGLFPAEVVKRLFRGKFLAAVKLAMVQGALSYPLDKTATYWQTMLNKLGRVKWQVYACKPYEHAHGVAKYLAKYMRGGALRNSQIISVKNGVVHLKYRSHQSKQTERIKYGIKAFEQQILRHMPLAGKLSIRYYGLYQPSLLNRLNKARQQLGQAAYVAIEVPDWKEVIRCLGASLVCPICGDELLKSGNNPRH